VKWNSFRTGHYHCVQAEEMRPIKDAEHTDIDETQWIDNCLVGVCKTLGANADDMVSSEKLYNSANS